MNRELIQEAFRKQTKQPTMILNKCEVGTNPEYVIWLEKRILALSIPRVRRWLLTRRCLWRKVVFDNGVVGRNYHRYNHILYPYVQGMGDNGKDGGVDTAISRQLGNLIRACA